MFFDIVDDGKGYAGGGLVGFCRLASLFAHVSLGALFSAAVFAVDGVPKTTRFVLSVLDETICVGMNGPFSSGNLF